ncbi:unnamed protein product [Phytophthora fragariaefolia]|uniref:Unnamed protein product n=1 Tax=Phytophthora fragariaefolia TaxID=1490495 RepID=A0A9W6XIK0_9STRA|nr:unnamed protein product [Phytophthora fragariaefolia]
MIFRLAEWEAESPPFHAALALLDTYGGAPPPLTAGVAHRALLFDGGSRGNPGLGGSGSILVDIDVATGAVRPLWIASMAYGNRKTTSNVAEYNGLLHGLKHAKSMGMHHLHIIGDSKLIIGQMEDRRPPKASRLIRLYWQCRQLADFCGVQSWTHHYRHFNKTADALANLAMATSVSRQVRCGASGFPSGCWDAALTHVHSDLSEWCVVALV